MKVLSARPLPREIGIGTPSPLSRVGDGSGGWALGQSGGSTHWDPVKRQRNLALSGSVRTTPAHEWFGGGSPITSTARRETDD